MKTLTTTQQKMIEAGRWDFDFHEPPVGIRKYPASSLTPISSVAQISRLSRNPEERPNESFQYVDISSIDVETGTISRPQELTGEEAPSRARKIIRAYDILISTCRPTRGAIAVVPEELHGQICSTGFSVLRVSPGINPFYLHYALRLPSSLEQFRKWATGSSYPAILDSDVLKTLVPMPCTNEQDAIASEIISSFNDYCSRINDAKLQWNSSLSAIHNILVEAVPSKYEVGSLTASWIERRLSELPSVLDTSTVEDLESEQSELFDE